MKQRVLKIIGWREWVALPKLGVKNIKAKIDSGARTSSLHAFNMKIHEKKGEKFVTFYVHPNQKNSKDELKCHAKVLEFRKVKSSNGHTELRPVILTPIELLDEKWEVEITLTNRDAMGFRMLIGREAMRKRFLIDTGNSYFGLKFKNQKTKNKE